LHRHPQQRPLNQKDIGRRVHALVHGNPPYHGGNLPLSAPNLRALLELLEADGHDVAALREELAHLLRTLLRARHLAVKLTRAAG
jgi:hypothetical protein